MPRNYDNGALVSVQIPLGGANVHYVFRSRIDSSLYNNLGQTPITAAVSDVTRMIVGANAPKPARASKLFPNNLARSYEGSFCSTDKIASLRADGWRITKGKKIPAPFETARSRTVYVTINGIKYAWQMAKPPAGIIPDPNLAQIGVKNATASDTDLVFGASFPKPPRAAIEHSLGRLETFRDPSTALTGDWIESKSAGKLAPNYTVAHFNQKYI